MGCCSTLLYRLTPNLSYKTGKKWNAWIFCLYFPKQNEDRQCAYVIKTWHAKNKNKADINKDLFSQVTLCFVLYSNLYSTKYKHARFAPGKSSWWSLQILHYKTMQQHMQKKKLMPQSVHCNFYTVALNRYSTYTTIHYNQ